MLARNGELITKEQINAFSVELMYPLEYFFDCIRGDVRIPVGHTIESLQSAVDRSIMVIDKILNDPDYTEDCFEIDTYRNLEQLSSRKLQLFGDYRVVKHENNCETVLLRNGDIASCVEYCCYFSRLSDDTSLTIEKEVSEMLLEEGALSEWDGTEIFEIIVTITANGVVADNYTHLSEKEKDLFVENIAICENAEFYHEGMFNYTK